METYFHEDPRIEEWVNQIKEKIFTVCLLTGVDSEVEFQSGSQIVSKLTNLLQSISIFPSEYLEDGLKQLVEQQLPDSRVINNFPTFQVTMNKMIHEGMRKALDSQNIEKLSNLDTSINDTPVKIIECALDSSSEHCNEDITKSMNDIENDDIPEKVIAALASGVGLQALRLTELMAISKDRTSVIESTIVPSTVGHATIANSTIVESTVVSSTLTKPYGILRKTQVPERADRLNQVLTNLFPNVTICWNFNLKGQKFLAQVEDILIRLDNPEQSCPVDNLNMEGWKVYECSFKDLMFPRRLERGLRQTQRLGKQSRYVQH